MTKNLILLVEDNPDDEFLALSVLKKSQVEKHTTVVRDGQEALDYLFREAKYADREPSNPQVILLDLKLPKVDGIEVLQKIRNHELTKLIPVVILTSSAEESDQLACYSKGANSYLVKPFTMEQFGQTIENFLYYWLGLNQGQE